MQIIHINEPNHSIESEARKAAIIYKQLPDVICFEFPYIQNYELSLFRFNFYDVKAKPKKLIEAEIQFCKKNLTPGSEKVIESITKVWDKGKNVFLYEIDGPQELTSVWHFESIKKNHGNLNIAWNYLREKIMFENIQLLKQKLPMESKIVVLCHNYHWNNIIKLGILKNVEAEIQYFFNSKSI